MLKINTGISDQIIPIHADDWSISFVKDNSTGKMITDQNEKPISMDHKDSTLVDGEWLRLIKTKDNDLKIDLFENFSNRPRDFIIGIQAGNILEEIHITQNRAEEYILIEQDFQEIQNYRKIYKSKEGVNPFSLTNNTSLSKKMELLSIFKDVPFSSSFSSDSYGAFDWMNKSNPQFITHDILNDNKMVWNSQIPYKNGLTVAYLSRDNEPTEHVLVAANSTVHVSGEIDYLETAYRYTFIIQNKSSGNLFKIKGIWSQKIPITLNIILNETEKDGSLNSVTKTVIIKP